MKYSAGLANRAVMEAMAFKQERGKAAADRASESQAAGYPGTEEGMARRLSAHTQRTDRALRNHFPCKRFPLPLPTSHSLFFKSPESQMTAAQLSDHVAVHSFAV